MGDAEGVTEANRKCVAYIYTVKHACFICTHWCACVQSVPRDSRTHSRASLPVSASLHGPARSAHAPSARRNRIVHTLRNGRCSAIAAQPATCAIQNEKLNDRIHNLNIRNLNNLNKISMIGYIISISIGYNDRIQ